MTDLKTLAEIWESADRKPVKVVGAGDEEHAPWQIIGILGNVAWLSCKEDDIDCQYEANRKDWKLYTEPKQPKRLWPAIIKHKTNVIAISAALFDSIESAQIFYEFVGSDVVRLANADDFKNGFLVED